MIEKLHNEIIEKINRCNNIAVLRLISKLLGE